MPHKNKSKRRYQSKRHITGGTTVMPLRYYNPTISAPAAGAGHDLLRVSSTEVRPKIGGKRRKLRKTRAKKHKIMGGFVPSVMDGFVAAASQFIVPLALYSGYKLLSRKQKKQGRKTRRR